MPAAGTISTADGPHRPKPSAQSTAQVSGLTPVRHAWLAFSELSAVALRAQDRRVVKAAGPAGGCVCGDKRCFLVAQQTGATYHKFAADWVTPWVLSDWAQNLGMPRETLRAKQRTGKISSDHFFQSI